MNCPSCHSPSRVLDTLRGDIVIRYHECKTCGHRFKSTQEAESAPRNPTTTGSASSPR